MASVKLNLNRTTQVVVPIETIDANGNAVMATFMAECKILKKVSLEDEKKPLINEILVSVSGLELFDGERALSEAEAVAAIADDIQLSGHIVQAWQLGNSKMLTKSKTYLEQSKG